MTSNHGSHHSSSSRVHSLIPGNSKKKSSSSSSSRMSDTSSSSFRTETNRRMKFIIAMGIALPILAAIIGVAAWAISADAVLPGPKSQGLHSHQSNFQPYSHDLVPMIESRSDPEFGPDSALLSSGSHPRPSRVDVDLLPAEASPEGHLASTEKDPLYIVHFVPTHKPNGEAAPIPSNSDSSQNILNKILSVSKGAKPGTPQFVVFAPVPGEEDNGESNEVKKESQINHDRRGVNNYDYNNEDIQEDYVYDEMVVGAKGGKANRPRTISRSGDNAKLSGSSNQEKQNQLATNFQSASHNTTVYKQHSDVYGTNYQNVQPNQPQHRPNIIPAQPRYPPIQQQQSYAPHHHKNPLQNHAPLPNQNYAPLPNRNYASPSNQNYALPSNQNYVPPPPVQYPQGNNAGAPDRSGYVDPNPSPIGIKLNFGNGGGLRGLLGGGYSPLGLIANILGPRLPRPALNLNGKLMFGVMLENGIKLGGNRPQTQYG